jgi:hypothetical protein
VEQNGFGIHNDWRGVAVRSHHSGLEALGGYSPHRPHCRGSYAYERSEPSERFILFGGLKADAQPVNEFGLVSPFEEGPTPTPTETEIAETPTPTVTPPPTVSWDRNGDGKIDEEDLLIWVGDIRSSTPDFNELFEFSLKWEPKAEE